MATNYSSCHKLVQLIIVFHTNLGFLFHQQALHENYSVDQIHELTSIDRWFLHKLHRIVEIERDMKSQEL